MEHIVHDLGNGYRLMFTTSSVGKVVSLSKDKKVLWVGSEESLRRVVKFMSLN